MVMTAVGGAPEWGTLSKLGASEFMVKPLLRDPFASAVHRLLKARPRKKR
jgi:DNA-binding NtrC family response regulator